MSDLQPSGTVTLVFTDVEGSTKLLEELGADSYRDALGEHRRIVRDAFALYQGYEVDYEGDAFFYAFASAQAALSAASDAMLGLEAGPIRIRVGIHTGEPALDPPKYVGMDVHRAARIMSAAHGGQVVLSPSTVALLEPGSFDLTDLGEHRLKDIAEAVPIFQLGSGSFPPLKTISNTNLPRPASSFVGREAELTEVLARIEGGARLVTLTGPGGTGKTRLALEAAYSLVPEHKAGVFWVGLAALRDPKLVTETIAQTLGAKDGLAEHIAERELLLLVDNVEQVIEAAPELSSLLRACPNLTLLVTSRELLRVRGEVEYPVPPLDEPEAVALFCQRAQVGPSEEIAELCARLDSLPLAVELAAARAKALSPTQILERLSQRLDLLKGGRDSDPRQQTLRATIEWSYELLAPGEQQLFAQLSVFAGGCTLEASEDVCDADVDMLQSLVEKSLVRFTNERYSMLETIREYAGRQLGGSGDDAEIRQRHANFFLALTNGANDALQTDAEAERVLRLLDDEHDNIRGALAWMIRMGRVDAYLDLIGQIFRFWLIRGLWIEGRRLVDAGLAGYEARDDRRAAALHAATNFALQLGDLDAARGYGEEGLSIRRELGDPKRVAHALSILATLAADQRDYEESERLFEEAAALWNEGPITGAFRAGSLADVAMRRGDYARAIALSEESLALFRTLERDAGTSWALYQLAFCLFRVGRCEEASVFANQALTLKQRLGEVESLIWLFVLIASLAADRMEYETGATLVGAAEVLRDQVGLALTGAEAELHGEIVIQLRDALGGGEYEALQSRGRSMTPEEAIRYAFSSLE